MSHPGVTDRLALLMGRDASAQQLASAPINILFVDDSETDYELMRFALRQAKFPLGPQTCRVEDEPGMRAALDAGGWDAIVSDYQMPRFSGQAALALALQHGNDIPFLIVSGAVGEDTAVNAMRAGASDYVMKHNLNRLPSALENALKATAVRQERQRAVEKLLASEEYLRTLITASPVAIIALDAQRQVALCNAAAEVMFPDLPQFVGKVPELKHAESQRLFGVLADMHQRGDSMTQRPANWVHNDGRVSDMLFSTASLQQSGGNGIVVFALDVTEQKKAEAARRESESRVAAISENLPGVLFRLVFQREQGQTFVPYVSPGAHDLFGITPDEFGSDSSRFMNLFDASGQDEIRHAVAASLQSGQTLQGQWKIVRHDGAERWIHLSASVREELAGERIFDGVISDVTAQKTAELELGRSREELRRLSAHMETLKEEERRAVSREIHDDIGSTLAGLKADIAWLRARSAADVQAGEKLNDMSQLVDGAMQTANRIIQALRPGILDYGIGPALEWQAQEFGSRMGLSVEFTSNEEDISVDLEQSTALFRVFQESLTNVAKYAGASKINTELFATASSITLEVRDDGKGLSEGDLAKDSSFGIRGMMERVRALGGWLDVSGSPGRGTTVMMSIPRKRPKVLPMEKAE
jgi:PAS domain S-box-containing protein